MSRLRVLITYPWARIYLFILSTLRAFVLGFGMTRGYKYYFPNLDLNSYLLLFAGLFLFHWIVVMFYQAINKSIVVTALLANTVFTILSRLLFVDTFQGRSIQEVVWLGSWFTILIDLCFVGIRLYNVYSPRKIKGNII